MNKHTSAHLRARKAWSEQRYLDAGREVYEVLTPTQRVEWTATMLRFCIAQSPAVQQIADVLALASAQEHWNLAHAAFNSVRNVTLVAEKSPREFDQRVKSLLYIAENTAKVIYNASGEPAPFDHDAGWWLAPCLQNFLFAVSDPTVTAEGTKLFFSPVAENAA